MTEPDISRAVWRASSRSGSSNCVEVAANVPGIIAVRDSKNPAGPKLIFSPATWTAFTNAIRTGEFDLA